MAKPTANIPHPRESRARRRLARGTIAAAHLVFVLSAADALRAQEVPAPQADTTVRATADEAAGATSNDDAVPGTDDGAGAGEARRKPATPPFQPRASLAVRVVVESGDLADVPAGAARAARAACAVFYAGRGARCAAARAPDVKEYHVLKSQPLTLAAYVDARALARMAGVRLGYIDPEPSYRFSTCAGDGRFEDGERISDTLVAKDAEACPAGAADGTPTGRDRAFAAIVAAESREGGDGGASPRQDDGTPTREHDGDGASRFTPRSMDGRDMP